MSMLHNLGGKYAWFLPPHSYISGIIIPPLAPWVVPILMFHILPCGSWFLVSLLLPFHAMG